MKNIFFLETTEKLFTLRRSANSIRAKGKDSINTFLVAKAQLKEACSNVKVNDDVYIQLGAEVIRYIVVEHHKDDQFQLNRVAS
jgi:hypothetical protein